jgi:hypothetical protein
MGEVLGGASAGIFQEKLINQSVIQARQGNYSHLNNQHKTAV